MCMLASFDCNDILNVTSGKCRKETRTSALQMKKRPIDQKNLLILAKKIMEVHKVMKYLV